VGRPLVAAIDGEAVPAKAYESTQVPLHPVERAGESGTQGRVRGRRIALVVAVALGALAIAPSGASALTPNECVQTNAPAPGQPSEWSCWSSAVTVSGYEVKRGTVGIPKPQGVTGHITKMEVDVADANGPIPIDRLMLHHIVFSNTAATDAACGGPERFFGAGEERNKLSFPDGYGYAYGPGSWAATYMYMNHRGQSDTAFIEYRLTIDPDPTIRSTRSYWLDVGNCTADPIYNVPGIDRPEIPNCAKAKKAAKRTGTKRARRKAARCKANERRVRASIPTEATHVVSKDVTVKQNGILVSGGGHVHGGAKELTLTKPSCGNLEVADSQPTWGNPDHPFYNVKPILHEPGPIGMSGFNTPTGIPVRNGQTLRLNSVYDDLQPHARVMGIYVVYLAPFQVGDSADPCGGAPSDTTYGPGTDQPGRTEPVPFQVPLTGLSGGQAVTIDGPPGEFKTLDSGATVTVGDRFFSEPNVLVRPGATINYRFSGNELHNLTLANGPLGIGSPDARGGKVYSQTFTRAGTYRFFCGLHPVQMSERVVVENPKPKPKKRKKRKARKR
jgi:plastocyanin